MTDFTLGTTFGINNVIVPKGGPKAAPGRLNFTAVGRIEIDGSQVISQGRIDYLQGVFIDNADNANPLYLTTGNVGQRIVAPAHSQGYYSIMQPNDPHLVAETTPGVIINVIFYNVPIQSAVWLTA